MHDLISDIDIMCVTFLGAPLKTNACENVLSSSFFF